MLDVQEEGVAAVVAPEATHRIGHFGYGVLGVWTESAYSSTEISENHPIFPKFVSEICPTANIYT